MSGLKGRLVWSVTAASAVMLILIVGGFNLALRSSLSGDADRLLEARVQAALEGIDVEGTSIRIREADDEGAPDAQVWIYDGNRNIERPPVAADIDMLADDLAVTGEGFVESGDVRLFATPIVDDSTDVGTVVAGLSLEPYDRSVRNFALVSGLLAAALIALIAVLTRTVVGRALRPVAEMTAAASDWSEQDLDRRFNPGPPKDELTLLASTFDQMLDRLAALVRHERNLSAEISHELRTPLSSIATEAELALNRDRDPGEYRASLERINVRATELTEIVETLLSVAREESDEGSRNACDLEEAIASAIRSFSAGDGPSVQIDWTPGAEPTRVQGSASAVQRILAPLLDNATAFAAESVRIRVEDDHDPRVVVEDDGPGIAHDDRERVFQPGVRGDTPRSEGSSAGAGLGLALSRRLAHAIGGEVTLADPPSGGGTRMSVTLRRAVASRSGVKT